MNKEMKTKLDQLLGPFEELFNLIELYRTNYPEFKQISDLAILENCITNTLDSFATVHMMLNDKNPPLFYQIKDKIILLDTDTDYLSEAIKDIENHCENYSQKVIDITKPIFKIARDLKKFSEMSSQYFREATDQLKQYQTNQKEEQDKKVDNLRKDFLSKSNQFYSLKKQFGQFYTDAASKNLLNTLDNMFSISTKALTGYKMYNNDQFKLNWENLNDYINLDIIKDGISGISLNMMDGYQYNLEAIEALTSFANESKEFFKEFIKRFVDVFNTKNENEKSTNGTMSQT